MHQRHQQAPAVLNWHAESAFLYCSASFEAVIRAPRISKPIQGVRGRLAEAIEISAEAWSIMVGLGWVHHWDASEAPAGTSSPHHSCLTVCVVLFLQLASCKLSDWDASDVLIYSLQAVN